jgi:Mrp family chromosome partitioning ATPase
VSTICVGVARALASHGRVLLVDASAEGLAISAWLNVERRPLGANEMAPVASEWIARSQAGIDVLNLDLTEEAASICESALADAQSKGTTRYRFVVVDLGSLQTLRAPGWAACLHRVYLVVDGSRASAEILGRARKELDLLKFPIAGAIMNRRVPSMGSFLHWSDA